MRQAELHFDKLKQELFSRVTGQNPSAQVWSHACLSLSDGGLGYCDTLAAGPAAYAAAFHQNLSATSKVDSSITESQVPMVRAFFDSLQVCSQRSGLAEPLTTEDLQRLQAESTNSPLQQRERDPSKHAM